MILIQIGKLLQLLQYYKNACSARRNSETVKGERGYFSIFGDKGGALPDAKMKMKI